MSIEQLAAIVRGGAVGKDWKPRHEAAFEALFGAPGGRYPREAMKHFSLRANASNADSGVPFAAYIHPSNAASGPYGGLSFAVFPSDHGPSLMALVIGTQGLAPDEEILGRPGHARKAQAICAWLNRGSPVGAPAAWAKQDPTRTDIGVPPQFTQLYPEYQSAFERYGKVMYACFAPRDADQRVEDALTCFLDLLLMERGFTPLTAAQGDFARLQQAWMGELMPQAGAEEVGGLLRSRRYVVLQGPPGTGKTRLALQLLREQYENRGRVVQFHPSVSYETFVGGLAPDTDHGSVGLVFRPRAGHLMQAAAAAALDPQHDHLLVVDEINRADLSKVLGEALYLLEVDETERTVELAHDFGEPFHRHFSLPPNLHLLGTMNSADRSIALVDVAVRRRFAFVPLWPSMQAVERMGGPCMQRAFRDLLNIFVEHATDDAFSLCPGHSYFFGDDAAAPQRLRTQLKPLLQEYLAQGFVAGFAESIHGYVQGLEG